MDDPKKVVLAEDNADNRELIRWMLESADLSIELVEAENGEEALRLVMELKPSLVLMDMSMPVLDGWEATKRIRATKEIANIPIIGLTAHAREEDKQRVLAIGCNEYVAKPINSDDFIEKVRRYLS
ncbi:MAG: response regulator [Bacteroidota bacterium]